MTAVQPIKVEKTDDYKEWLAKLADLDAKAVIIERIERVEEGNLGDTHPVTGAPGLYELRFFIGPGYRVYFIKVGSVIILLLCAGDKSTQTADIKRAKSMLNAIKAQRAAAKKAREKAEKADAKARQSKPSKRNKS